MARVLRSGGAIETSMTEVSECSNSLVNSGESKNGVEIISDDKNYDAEITGEISESVMRYQEGLLQSHERNLTERFAMTESKQLAKIDYLETKIAEKDVVITDLQSSTSSLEKKVTQIENQMAVVRAANSKLLIDQDDLQQYGRRTNIRIEGIEFKDNESSDDLKVKIEQTLQSVGVDVRDDLLERYHRSGAPYHYNGKRVAQTIVRLRFWKQRFQAQRGKKVARDNKIYLLS